MMELFHAEIQSFLSRNATWKEIRADITDNDIDYYGIGYKKILVKTRNMSDPCRIPLFH